MGGVVSSVFGGVKTPAVPPPPPVPTIDTAEVSAAAAEERKRRAAAEGRASTMLTGLAGEEQPSVSRAKLLGL